MIGTWPQIGYHQNKSINWQDYFEDIIGVTKPLDEGVKKVILHFYGKTGKYMESKPVHGSQKSKWLDEHTLEVSLEIIINYELERLILSYADSVKVIQPNGLIKKLKDRLKEAYLRY